MRVHLYFQTRYRDMVKDLKSLVMPMKMKIKLLQEIQDTYMMVKQIFQDDRSTDQRSLISSICKSIELSSSMRLIFLTKFLRDFPDYNIDVDYIKKNFSYIQGLSLGECSKSERTKILKTLVKKK